MPDRLFRFVTMMDPDLKQTKACSSYGCSCCRACEVTINLTIVRTLMPTTEIKVTG